MIAVCVPSRGLIHSRTVEHINNNLQGYEYKMYMSHDLPIPDCFNDTVGRALSEEPSYVWIVEEDMGFSDDTFDSMMFEIRSHDAVLLDYPVKKGIMSVNYRDDGTLDYGGVGCLLIRPEAIKDVMPFSSSFIYTVGSDEPKPANPDRKVYGKQDVHLYKTLFNKGYDTYVMPQKAWQYRVVQYGEQKTNKGYHDIEHLTD